MNKIKIGTIFSHPGKQNIRICGYAWNGRYLARQILDPVRNADLLRGFGVDEEDEDEMLDSGVVLRYPDRTIELVKRKDDNTWENDLASEIIELGAGDLERWEPVNLQQPSKLFHGTEAFPLQREKTAKEAGRKGG